MSGQRSKPHDVSTPELRWFWDHYEEAAGQIVSFCRDAGLPLDGAQIADVGCGDGMMALGLHDLVHPGQLIGFDIVPTNVESLLGVAKRAGVFSGEELPAELRFEESSVDRLPAEDNSFDFAYSWSAFEHIETPIEVLSEIRRIIRPGGHFFLQLWPFYYSSKGSHLWDWFPEDHHHLTDNDRDIVEQIGQSDVREPGWTAYMTREFEHLNRISVDELQRALLASGFNVLKVELITHPVLVRPALARYSWTDLATGGIKLLASPLP